MKNGRPMKGRLKALMPRFVLRAYYRHLRAQEDARNLDRTPEEVFSEIYRQEKWGGSGQRFCSGSGSTSKSIVGPYVNKIRECLQSCGPEKPRVVDLGCGDFFVGRQLLDFCSTYTGIDVVPGLIQHLRGTVNDDRVEFLCLDIVRDPLPHGDVCLIRQVLQHLSNAQISRVLAKLTQYRTIFVTEHYPSNAATATPNLDKVHGSAIRLFEHSGVYLDQSPFDVPPAAMELILEVPGEGFGGLYEPGLIRTFRLTTGRNERPGVRAGWESQALPGR